MIPIRHLGWTAFALIALVGCEPPAPPPVPGTPPSTAPAGSPEAGKDATEIKSVPVEPAKSVPVEPAKPDEAKPEAKTEGAAVDKLSPEEVAEIKKLPANEQAIALAQVVCPVSGDHLGDAGMGAPIKQVIGEKTFFICCPGCEKTVKSDPSGVLAKLKK